MGLELLMLVFLLLLGGWIWFGYMKKKKRTEEGHPDPDQQNPGKPGGKEDRS
jgi:cytochrome c-type biogenesis protein CcmH/NrfF